MFEGPAAATGAATAAGTRVAAGAGPTAATGTTEVAKDPTQPTDMEKRVPIEDSEGCIEYRCPITVDIGCKEAAALFIKG